MKKILLRNFYLLNQFVIGLLPLTSNAQIIYTDVNPDFTSSGSYNLDPNNDGTIDFVIKHTSKPVKGTGKCKGQTTTNQYINVTPLNNNQVLDTGGNARRILANETIDGSASSWNNTSNQLMISSESKCTYFSWGDYYVMFPTSNGQWYPHAEDGFLGLRLIYGGRSYFGWLRLSISDNDSGFIVRDYAFNSKPDQAILAGQSSTKYLGILPISNLDQYFCSGNSFTVSYMMTGSFSSSNIVTAELSDVSGSFANPVAIGSVTSNTSGNINAVIPGLTAYGYGYRIRVTSSNPVRTSFSTLFNSTIDGDPPGETIYVGNTSLCENGTVDMYAYYGYGGCCSYEWKRNGIAIQGATMNYYYATEAGYYKCIISNAAGTVTSDIVTVTACNAVSTDVAKPQNSNKNGYTGLKEFKLKIAPNPVTSSAIISFLLSKTENVSMKIFDINGRLISTITEAAFPAGTHQLRWNAVNVKNGVYVLRLQAGNFSGTRKLVVLK